MVERESLEYITSNYVLIRNTELYMICEDEYLRSCWIPFWFHKTEDITGIGEGRATVGKTEPGCRQPHVLIQGDKDFG